MAQYHEMARVYVQDRLFEIPPTETPYGIDVDAYVQRYGVENELVADTLHQFPTLVFLLGKTASIPVESGGQPDRSHAPAWQVTEGSGMFGLKAPEDAKNWAWIFNHVMGSARHVYALAVELAHLSSEQKQMLAVRKLDLSLLTGYNPNQLLDFFLITHAGRRQADEVKLHKLNDENHLFSDPMLFTELDCQKVKY